MARIDTLSNFLTDVATAIKTKKGDDTPIPASNFDTEITNLPSGDGNLDGINELLASLICIHENKSQIGTWRYTGNFDDCCYTIDYKCHDCNEEFVKEVQHDWYYEALDDGRGTVEVIIVRCRNNCICEKEVIIGDPDFDYYYQLYLEMENK